MSLVEVESQKQNGRQKVWRETTTTLWRIARKETTAEQPRNAEMGDA